MAPKSKGFRAGSRHVLRKSPRNKGKISITRYLQKFNIGDRVAIDIEPSVHKGMPHPRFQGRVGKVIGKRGRAYIIEVPDMDSKKILIVLPVHLKKV